MTSTVDDLYAVWVHKKWPDDGTCHCVDSELRWVCSLNDLELGILAKNDEPRMHDKIRRACSYVLKARRLAIPDGDRLRVERQVLALVAGKKSRWGRRAQDLNPASYVARNVLVASGRQFLNPLRGAGRWWVSKSQMGV